MGSTGETRLESWQEISLEARRRRDALIPVEHRLSPDVLFEMKLLTNVSDVHEKIGLFTVLQLEIISSSAAQILARVAKSEWTAVQVTEAFCLSASVAQQLVRIHPLMQGVWEPLINDQS